jgi:hypothetical protein
MQQLPWHPLSLINNPYLRLSLVGACWWPDAA